MTLINSIVAAALSLASYVSIYLPVEYLVTEVLLLNKEIFPSANLVFLLGFALILSQVDWEKKLETKSSMKKLAIIIVASSLIFSIYKYNKLKRECLPKIYHVTPDSGIQAQIIKIKGFNLFPAWISGKVIIGNQEAKILKWDDDLITVQQPVPAKFGQVDLYIVRDDGAKSNKTIFEIMDPGKL